LKPFVYGMAMDDGLIHPASLLQDVPRRFSDYRPGNFDSGFHGPVSASEALVRSLNLPAVQVLEAYGPKRFAANLRNAGLPLMLPAGAEPNLSLILGGAGARLEDIVAAYSAFARHGKAARLRMTPDDPLVERPLLSPGAAWIVRRILAGEAQPVPDASLVQVVPLAWKTGTSYGYRDAWAVGVNARYLIGIWTGRPDGTPVVGQFGFASAVPLLNQVNNLLLARPAMSRGGLPVDPRPATVSAGRSAGPAGRICRRATATAAVAWPAGCWMTASRRRCCCRARRGRGIRFPVWLMNRANGWRRIARARGKWSMSGRCRWNPGCRASGARASGPVSDMPPLQTDAAPLVLSGIREGR
jgi:penicillin-binding protein 1C